jgi:outer membrane protein assembly factor BamD (BamD/ComL family)
MESMIGRITIATIFLMMLLMGCSGRKPETNWVAEEYFQYAKQKFEDEDYWEASNEFTVVILRFPGFTWRNI